MRRTVHIIGAGIAGLAAAVRLAERRLQRASCTRRPQQAGGRCRSYFDARLGMTIDNGNHLLLSGNHAALAYLRDDRRRGRLVGPDEAEFPFVDLADRRALDAAARTTAGCRGGSSTRRAACRARALRDYLGAGARCCGRRDDASRSARSITCDGTLYERLVQPLLLAALNIDPPRGLGQARRRGGARDARCAAARPAVR